MHGFKFELITGPVSCGKTEELIRRLKRCLIANKNVKVFSPLVDTRSLNNSIESRNGCRYNAIKVDNAIEILDYVDLNDQVIGIDELQFFDKNITNVVVELIQQGKKIIGTGLELDFKAEPFGFMGDLLCYADKVDKLTAICMKCGSEFGNRTQRLIDGKPVDRNSPLIMVGGDELYEARCINCFEINHNSESFLNLPESILQV